MKPKKFDSINVVPFIDIMLVLLVIVLTTATFIAKGIIPVDLPNGNSTQKIKNIKNLTITITKDGRIFFEKSEVAKDRIYIELKKYDTKTPIKIYCDKEAKFDTFVYILNQLKSQKFNNLGIVTKNE